MFDILHDPGTICEVSEAVLLPAGNNELDDTLAICLAVEDHIGVSAFHFSRSVRVLPFATTQNDPNSVISNAQNALNLAITSGSKTSTISISNALLTAIDQATSFTNNNGNSCNISMPCLIS